MTGTAVSTLAPCSSTSARVRSGSNRRESTSVDSSSCPNDRCAKPQAWNIGEATTVVSRARSGIADSSDTSGSSAVMLAGMSRAAPLGLPVVPLVSSTCRPARPGGGGSVSSPAARSSSDGGASGRRSPSRQACTRGRAGAASATTSSNSSSATTRETFSSRSTSASCGAPKPVLR